MRKGGRSEDMNFSLIGLITCVNGIIIIIISKISIIFNTLHDYLSATKRQLGITPIEVNSRHR